MPKLNSLAINELLARYRGLFVEHVSSEREGDDRVESQKFVEKVQVNIEFFDVIWLEVEGNSWEYKGKKVQSFDGWVSSDVHWAVDYLHEF